MGMTVSLKRRLLHLFFPLSCVGCLEDLACDAELPLCEDCAKKRLALDGPIPLRKGSPLDAAWGLYAYRTPLPELIHAFKYQGCLPFGRILGEWLAEAFSKVPELGRSDAVVPVPLHPSRERERGFNQAAALAAPVSRSAELPLLDALLRVRSTRPQWRLDRKGRRENLRNTFQARPGMRLDRGRYVLIDDVFTTGETLEGCAGALKRAGACRVYGFVLARD